MDATGVLDDTHHRGILNQMVYSQDALDRTFQALADPTRRGMLAHLARGEAAISELARPLAMTLPAAVKHVRVLERAGLAVVRRDGRVRRCRLVATPLQGAAQWMDFYRRFWEQQFDSLARYLDEATPTTDESWPRTQKQPKKPQARTVSWIRRKSSSTRGSGTVTRSKRR